MRRRIESRSESKSTEHDEDNCGEDVDCLRRQVVGEPVAKVDDSHVRQHHAQRLSRYNAEELVKALGQCNGERAGNTVMNR